MIPVKIREVVLDQVQNPLLLLVDMDETMVLPIGIGFWEAQAIVLKLQGHVPPRLMTHDLIKSLCGHLGATVEKIVVTDIKDSIFFAEIYLQTGGRVGCRCKGIVELPRDWYYCYSRPSECLNKLTERGH